MNYWKFTRAIVTGFAIVGWSAMFFNCMLPITSTVIETSGLIIWSMCMTLGISITDTLG